MKLAYATIVVNRAIYRGTVRMLITILRLVTGVVRRAML